MEKQCMFCMNYSKAGRYLVHCDYYNQVMLPNSTCSDFTDIKSYSRDVLAEMIQEGWIPIPGEKKQLYVAMEWDTDGPVGIVVGKECYSITDGELSYMED